MMKIAVALVYLHMFDRSEINHWEKWQDLQRGYKSISEKVSRIFIARRISFRIGGGEKKKLYRHFQKVLKSGSAQV